MPAYTRASFSYAKHDPNSYFLAGATAADFRACLEQAQPYENFPDPSTCHFASASP